MIKKFFKWVFKILAGLLLIAAISYGGFHLWEYATGGKYVEYLTENSETIPLEASFTFEELGKDAAANQLILVGEIHGFDQPNKFDVDLFKYLHQNHNVNHYIAELDFVQALLLNDFLKTGDESSLKEILKKWVVVQGRNNQDYFDKFIAFHKYYQELLDNDKFEFVGIDRIQDGDLLRSYLVNLYPDSTIENTPILDDKPLGKIMDELNTIYAESSDTLFILSHIKTNIEYIESKENREEVLFQNFSRIYKTQQLAQHKLYGYFGLYHVFQYRVNGNHPLASKIRTSDLGLEGKILSINCMMNDSYMVMPSNQLPEFMREKGPYTRMPVSADNMLIMYIVGVKDFKRMTPENHQSLIKMNGEDSPYKNTIRLNKTIQLLPVTDILEMTDKGEPYVQYTVFMRNSDWAEPMK
jgi:hypothetical protein